MLGTPHYLAPEQADGRADRVTVASDVYSLGATLYELLEGHPPFAGSSAVAVLKKVLEEPAVFSRGSRSQQLPRDLEAICLKCLEKQPAQRYPSAIAPAQDLRRFLSGRPTIGRPVGPIQRALRAIRRRPVVSGLVGSLAITMITGTVVSLSFQALANSRAKEAEHQRAKAIELQTAYARQSADLLLDRGVQLAGQGDTSAGLSWMLSALKLSADSEIGQLARVDLETWSARSPHLIAWIDAGRSGSALSEDGGTLVTADQSEGHSSDDPGCLRFWNTSTGQPIGPALPLPDRYVGPMRFSPDGRYLVTCNGSAQSYQYRPGWVRLWDVVNQRELARLDVGGDAATAVAWLDSTRFVVGNIDQKLRMFSAPSGQPAEGEINAGQPIRTLSLSCDQHYAACCDFKSIQIVDLTTAKAVGSPRVFPATITSSAFTRAGDALLVASEAADNRGHRLCIIPLDPTIGAIGSAASDLPTGSPYVTVLRDGRIVAQAVNHDDGQTRIEFNDGTRIWRTKFPPSAEISSVVSRPGPVFTHSGKWAWCNSTDGRLQLLGGLIGSPAGPPMETRAYCDALSLSCADDGRWAAVVIPASPDHPVATTARLFDVRTGEPVGPVLEQGNTIISTCFSPDGSMLAFGGHSHDVDVVRVPTGEPVLPTLPQGDMVTSLRFAPDGKQLAVATFGQQVLLWDVTTGKKIGQPLQHQRPVWGLWFGPAGKRLVTADDDGTYIWDLASRTIIATLPDDPARAVVKRFDNVAFASDGKLILIPDRVGSACVWDGQQFRHLELPALASAAPTLVANRFDISPDGRWAGAVFDNGTVRMWQIASGKLWGAPTSDLEHLVDLRFNNPSTSYRVFHQTGLLQRVEVIGPTTSNLGAIEERITHQTGLSSDYQHQPRLLTRVDRAIAFAARLRLS